MLSALSSNNGLLWKYLSVKNALAYSATLKKFFNIDLLVEISDFEMTQKIKGKFLFISS
jgi:hypothetical protein